MVTEVSSSVGGWNKDSGVLISGVNSYKCPLGGGGVQGVEILNKVSSFQGDDGVPLYQVSSFGRGGGGRIETYSFQGGGVPPYTSVLF